MKKNIISVRELSYKKILNDISFDIPEGAFVSISGSNNCGKTTLIKMLSGLISSNNMVMINGFKIESINKTKLFYDEGIVILNENINFLFDTVKDEIMFILDNIKMDEELKLNRYNSVLKLLNLSKYEKVNPNTLNRNNKILVLLALAIIHKPKILYLDDIDSMMSKSERKNIMNVLHYLNKKENMTIVMATSKLEMTLNTDYLYILSDGNLVLEGKPLDLLKDDNVINKLGLSIPFMVDLSVKLKDYDLIDNIILEMEGMVDLLWK